MKKLFTLIWLLVCTVSFANNDKYRLILVSDPATTITIGWNQISGSNPVVYYGTTDFGTVHTSYPNSKTVDRAVNSRGMNNNFARLTGLTPDTAYYFVINDSQGTSERFWFRTAPNDTSRLSFIAGGDSRNNRGPRQDANRVVAKLKPHAVLFGGDMTSGDSSSEWQDWLDDWQLTTSSVDDANNVSNRMIPIVPTVGNHEGSDVIWELFDTPDSDSYYAITFGDNMYREYTLNTNISVSGNQLTWLENDLSNNLDTRWRSAQYHKPMRPHQSGKSEGEAHYQAWAELFYDSGVRLVTDSDSHTVKTTWPVKPTSEAGSDEGFIREDIYGTVYAGEGCWGAPLRASDDDKAWTRNSASFNQFKLIYVGLNEIELRTIEVDNESSIPNLDDNDKFGLTDSTSYMWNPSEGMVVTIDYIDLPSSPEIAFIDGASKDFTSGTNISLDIDVIDDGDGITKVDFYIDGALETTDNTSPFNFTHTYIDGSYLVEAIATNVALRTDLTSIRINVGTFTNNEIVFIADGNDDVEEEESTGDVYFDSSDLEFFDDGGWQIIGLRFQDINIPKGATISSADIRFKSDASDSQSGMDFKIYIEDAGDANPFESNSSQNVSARNKYATAVDWENVANWSNGERGSDTTTDDLTALLQGVIDRCDWDQGNSMAFIFERIVGNSSSTERRADTYEENGAADSAQLRFSYTYNTFAPAGVTKYESNAWTDGIPDSSSTVIINDDYNTSLDGGSIVACNLTVKSGNTLTITAGEYLDIEGNLVIEGDLVIEHEGSVVQHNDASLATNNGNISVEKITPALTDRGFTILGSPMTSETTASVYGSASFVRYHDTNLFTPHPDVENDFPLANNFADDNGDNWQSHSGTLNTGEGYLVKPFAIGETGGTYTTYYTLGTLNNGDITFTTIYGDDQNDSPNILSNPYASAIRVDDFLNANAIAGGTVYFWEHLTAPSNYPGYNANNYNMGDISSRNNTGGLAASNGVDVPSNYIPSGQGFGIKASAAGTITFNNAMRSTDSNTGYRNSTVAIDRLYLNISNNTYSLKSQTLIGFTELATNGFDQNYDSKRLATPVSIYSLNSDRELGIQGKSVFNVDHIIPLGFSSQIEENQEYTISISSIEGELISNATVYLKDNQLNTITNLSETDYTFISNAGHQTDRFVIVFSEEILGANSLSITSISIYPNPTQNVLNIVSPNIDITGVAVYDVRGRLMISKTLDNQENYQLDLSTLRSSLYFVKISTQKGSVTKRIIKK